MKHLKSYKNIHENNEPEPEIGDYVICKETEHENYPQSLYDFINNNTGLIINKYKPKYSPTTIEVKYENTPTELKSKYFFGNGARSFAIYQVETFGPTPEITLAKNIAKNYNL